jgi:hypothetical protein
VAKPGIGGRQQAPIGATRLRISADMACNHGDQFKIEWVEVTEEAQILFALNFCRTNQGIVRFEHMADESGQKPSLQLQAEQGRYMVSTMIAAMASDVSGSSTLLTIPLHREAKTTFVAS